MPAPTMATERGPECAGEDGRTMRNLFSKAVMSLMVSPVRPVVFVLCGQWQPDR